MTLSCPPHFVHGVHVLSETVLHLPLPYGAQQDYVCVYRMNIRILLITKSRSTTIFYVYSTAKIIQVPPVASANGLFLCTTRSEIVACQPSIIYDSNSYLGLYYLSQPTAATHLPGSLFRNAIEPAANASVHVNTILTFPTPFTYLPSVGDRLEELGYVPRSILDWMLQQEAYTGHASLLASCSPGGPLLGPLVPNTSAVVPVDTLLPPPTSIIGTPSCLRRLR